MRARLDSLENLFKQLKQATAPKAQRIFERLKSNVDVQRLLEDLDIEAGDDDETEPATTSDTRGALTTQTGGNASSVGPVSLRDAPVSEKLVPITWQIEIPDAKATREAVDNFFDCAGQLLHVFTRKQAAGFQEEVFNGSPRTPSWKASACCLCAIAAIGKVYNGTIPSSGSAHVYYNVSKSLFEDLIEIRSLDAMKVCTLLALYNIFDKATLALVHIGK